MKKFFNKIKERIKSLWSSEPARVTAATIAGVGFVLNELDVAFDVSTVTVIVGFVLPLLFGGEIIRSQVSPVGTSEGPGDSLAPDVEHLVISDPAKILPDVGNAGDSK